MAVLFIGSIQGFLSIVGAAAMVFFIVMPYITSECHTWAERIVGRSICEEPVSFRLVMIALLILSLVVVVCCSMLLRGVHKRCRDDLLPWLISNGAVIPVSMALLIQQTATSYITDTYLGKSAEYWFYYSIYWAVNLVCVTLVAREYNSMGPSKKEKQYKENIKYLMANPNFSL